MSGFNSVMLVEVGKLFIEKLSPSTAVISVSESIIKIFTFSVKVKLKSTCPSAPDLISEVNLSFDSVLS